MSKSRKKAGVKCPYERLEFTPQDYEVMDLALDYNPELRLCAGIAKAARSKKLSFPIKSAKELIKLLPKKNLFVEGHQIRAALIERYMRKEYFPLANERELIARCYLALTTCKENMAWAANAPTNALDLIKEYKNVIKTKGEA